MTGVVLLHRHPGLPSRSPASVSDAPAITPQICMNPISGELLRLKRKKQGHCSESQREKEGRCDRNVEHIAASTVDIATPRSTETAFMQDLINFR